MAGLSFYACYARGPFRKRHPSAIDSRFIYPVVTYHKRQKQRLDREDKRRSRFLNWQYKSHGGLVSLDPQLQIAVGTAEVSSSVWSSNPCAEVYALCEEGQLDRALNHLLLMEQRGEIPSVHVYRSLLKACTKRKALFQAKQLHSHMARCGLECSNILGEHLVTMLVKCGGLEESLQVFHKLPYRSAFSWTAVITGLTIAGEGQEALRMYKWMQADGVEPNGHTFVSLLKACASISDLEQGKYIHTEILKYRCEADLFVSTCLVDMYGKSGSILDAENVFDGMLQHDLVSWNALLSAYAHHDKVEKVFQMYEQMEEEGFSPNDRTFVSLLQACCILADIEDDVVVEGVATKPISHQKGKVLHAYARTKGCDSDVFVCSTLVTMYGKCGSVWDALDVFGGLPYRDVVSWNSMLVAFIQRDQAEDAMRLYETMLEEGARPNARTLVSACQACWTRAGTEENYVWERQSVKVNSLVWGRVIHAYAHKIGCDLDVFVGSALVNMYGKCGSIMDAKYVFHRLSVQNVVSWTGMLAGYVEQGQAENALQTYKQMLEEGVTPDIWTFMGALQACGVLAEKAVDAHEQPPGLKALEMGKEIHAETQRQGNILDVVLVTTLISMYGKCGSIVDAQFVFDESSESSVVVWTAMISAYCQQGHPGRALQLYAQMREEGVNPNQQTFASVFHACSILAVMEIDVSVQGHSTKVNALAQGKALHADARSALNVFSGNTLISMYGKCGSPLDAQNVFDGLSVRNVVSWTTLLMMYVDQGWGEKALQMYEHMMEEGVSPDNRTLAAAIQACGIVADQEVEVMLDGEWTKVGSLQKGHIIHAHARRKGYHTDDFVGSTMVTMYAKCGSTASAKHVFDVLSKRNVVARTAMLGAYVQQGQAEKALRLHSQMEEEGVSPDETSLVCILQACGHTGSVAMVMQIHHRLASVGNHINPGLANILIHAYGSCASMAEARAVFDALPQPDVVSWTTLIAAYARVGNYKESLKCYEEMRKKGIKPNSITCLSLLSACSHAGLVENGVKYFESMGKEHGITPEIEHYVTMVDLLSRAGYFATVKQLLSTMPMQPDLDLWLCLLSGCRKYGEIELAERAFRSAVHLKPNHVAAYILMSNIYADSGLWDSANRISAEVTALRKKGDAWKKAGQSWIEHDKAVHRFSIGECNLWQHELSLLSFTLSEQAILA